MAVSPEDILHMLHDWWPFVHPCPVADVHLMETGTFQGLLMLKIEQVFWAGKLFEQPLPESDLNQGKETPPWFYHGTDVYNMLQVLICGLMSSGDIRQRPHTPDGVYCYMLQDESLKSMYFKGAVVTFRNDHSICVSEAETRKLMKIPQKIIGRRMRSLARRVGNEGCEFIHCAADCCVTAVFCDMVLLSKALESLIALPPRARVSFPEAVTRAMAWAKKQVWKGGADDKDQDPWKPDWKGGVEDKAQAEWKPDWKQRDPAGFGFPPPPSTPPPPPPFDPAILEGFFEAGRQVGLQQLRQQVPPALSWAQQEGQQQAQQQGQQASPAFSWAQQQGQQQGQLQDHQAQQQALQHGKLMMLMQEWAVKGVLQQAMLCSPAIKRKWCWQCRSMSLVEREICTKVTCPFFGFSEDLEFAQTQASFRIGIGG